MELVYVKVSKLRGCRDVQIADLRGTAAEEPEAVAVDY